VARGATHILTHPGARRLWWLKCYLPYSWYLALVRRQLAAMQARMLRPASPL